MRAEYLSRYGGSDSFSCECRRVGKESLNNLLELKKEPSISYKIDAWASEDEMLEWLKSIVWFDKSKDLDSDLA